MSYQFDTDSCDESDAKFEVFHRTWWRLENGVRVPGVGESYHLGYAIDQEMARAKCKEWNDCHDPGYLSDKAEFTSDF